MYAEYKRDMNHNYLVLHGDAPVDTASYQVRMLAGNAIPSLLKCRLQGIDGNVLFYYDITSRQSVSSLFEKKKFRLEDLQLIFGGFIRVMEEMSEYLLNPGQLLLRPEYMYLDVESKEMYFCYLPGVQQDVREQFQSLTEYVLPKLDHEDGRAVMLGYGIYRRSLEDSFHLEHVKEEIFQMKEDVPKEQIKTEHSPEFLFEEPKQTEAAEDFWQLKEEPKCKAEKTFPIKLFLICAVSAIAILAVMCTSYLGLIPWIPVEGVMAFLILVLGTGMVIYYLYERDRRRKKEKAWRERLEKRAALIHAEKQETLDIPAEPKTIQEPSFQEHASVLAGKENYGETVVLSANLTAGPASLVSREPGELATIYLTEELTVVGKLEYASDAVIPLPTVSRVHARIRKREEEYYLTDLNSRNGTAVNGRMLKAEEEYQLQDEDEVDFAQARYIFLK